MNIDQYSRIFLSLEQKNLDTKYLDYHPVHTSPQTDSMQYINTYWTQSIYYINEKGIQYTVWCIVYEKSKKLLKLLYLEIMHAILLYVID